MVFDVFFPLSLQLSGLISSVKQENSAFKKQDIVEWELEINPCEHTLTL